MGSGEDGGDLEGSGEVLKFGRVDRKGEFVTGVPPLSSSSSLWSGIIGSNFFLRCIIFQRQSGVCLLDRVWEWPIEASPHDISKMVLSFYQISGELGFKEKGVNQVIFGVDKEFKVPNFISRKKLRKFRGRNTNGRFSIRMITAGDENVLVGVFHRSIECKKKLLYVDEFTNEILNGFKAKELSEKMADLQNKYAGIFSSQLDLEYSQTDVLHVFRTFEPVIDSLKDKYLELLLLEGN